MITSVLREDCNQSQTLLDQFVWYPSPTLPTMKSGQQIHTYCTAHMHKWSKTLIICFLSSHGILASFLLICLIWTYDSTFHHFFMKNKFKNVISFFPKGDLKYEFFYSLFSNTFCFPMWGYNFFALHFFQNRLITCKTNI